MTILWSIAGFILAIAILVTIHEWGHYSVARLFNIKVTDFSIGFGKKIFSFQYGETNFQLAMIPLGGFVKFLDEREESFVKKDNEDCSRAYNRQSIFVKFAVVIAGPLVNLIFAWVVFSLIYFSGITGFKPQFQKVEESSPLASKLSDLDEPIQIIKINGKKVNTWNEVDQNILLSLVNQLPLIKVEAISFHVTTKLLSFELPLASLDINNPKINRIKKLGFIPKLPSMPAILGEVKDNSPAKRAGFISGDKILTVDNVFIKSWHDFVSLVRKNPNKELLITYSRKGVVYSKNVKIASLTTNNKEIGFFGATILFDESLYTSYRTKTNYSFYEAMLLGYDHTIDLINMSLVMIKRMLFGDVDVANLSGPISIADYSGQALQLGWGAFFSLLALLSLSLGIINLLPIPVLDGGHLSLYMIEIIKGTPLSSQIELILQQFGVLVIFSLTFFVIFNDLVRIFND